MQTSIFDKKEWIKYLPKELTIVTLNGQFTLKITKDPASFISVVGPDQVQITYSQNTMADSGGDASRDGEPDFLEFDLSMVKENDGSEANPDTLKIGVSISYGDSMVSEFTISKPNKVGVTHYTGPSATNVKESMFGFNAESLKKIVEFFNRFGFQLDTKSFKFIDEYLDTYTPESKISRFKDFINEGIYHDNEKQLKTYTKKFNQFIDTTYKMVLDANQQILENIKDCMVDLEDYVTEVEEGKVTIFNESHDGLVSYHIKIDKNQFDLLESVILKLDDIIGEGTYQTDCRITTYSSSMRRLGIEYKNNKDLVSYIKEKNMNEIEVNFYFHLLYIEEKPENM